MKKSKLFDDIDTNKNGRISKREIMDYENKMVTEDVVTKDIPEPKSKFITLVCPKNGHQYSVDTDKLDEFYLVFGADETWRV